jgi:glutamate 5-kinase
VVLVSSGAVAAGRALLREHTVSGSDLVARQALAALGQAPMIALWQSLSARPVAQVLLTHDDLRDRRRYLNARATLRELLALHVLPVVNENDTVAVEEIKLGDNDNLSSMVATLIDAAILIILSDVDGLYTADPSRDPGAELVRVVEKITPQVERYAKKTRGELSTGGMATKIEAARRCVGAGIAVVITNGARPDAIDNIFAGNISGTVFLPADKTLSMRKQWIGFVSHTKGSIAVDDGAKNALLKKHKSLLPSGITEVRGEFKARDIVSIVDAGGTQIGKGITGYSSADLNRIKGQKSSEIETILHRKAPAEVIHRNNLAPMGE